MTWFQTSFQWAGELYSTWFAAWLHVDFLIRTAILLMMLWMIIYVAGMAFKYIIGPLAILFYVHVLKRGWNFFVTETIHEWIYINHYSQGSQQHASWYLRLCDRVKHNRTVIDYTRYRGILRRGRVRKLGNHMMIAAGIIVTLWVGAFGLNQEYAVPAWAGTEAAPGTAADPQDDTNIDNNNEYGGENDDNNEAPSTSSENGHDIVHPSQFPHGTDTILALVEETREIGARLRDGPGTRSTVIEMVWGYDLMIYLGHYVPDDDVEALFWLRVRTPSGMEGYIGSQLVEVVG